MVAFLTLLLGLTVGVQRIELAVDHRVATVELRLDGRQIAVLSGAPWVAECDFGQALLPHHLEAIARDAGGRELDRALQRVNLPREAAEVALRLEGSADGYTGAELSWRAADESEPEEIQVRFDGEPLEVEGRRVALPRYDAKTVHVLSAEVIFPRQVRAQVELAFGGEYGEEVSSELTAVPLELDSEKELPSSAQIEAWLQVGEQPVRVAAVERGPREVVLVRDDASEVTLRNLVRQVTGRGPQRSQSSVQRMISASGLSAKDALRVMGTHPIPVAVKSGGYTPLFPLSANVNSATSGFAFVLTNVFFRPQEGQLEEQLAEAVSLAGIRASASNRARAVLLVRSTQAGAPTKPGLRPTDVRSFLSALRVPLFYWTVGPAKEGASDPWGEATPIRGWGGVHGAVTELMDALRPQFLVWIEGLHKPGDVTLSAQAPAGLRLAGAPTLSGADTRPSRPASPDAAE